MRKLYTEINILYQGSPTCLWPIGHQATGMDGKCTHVCTHPPHSCQCHCAGVSSPDCACVGVLASPPESHGHQHPICTCTRAPVPSLCMRMGASSPFMYTHGCQHCQQQECGCAQMLANAHGCQHCFAHEYACAHVHIHFPVPPFPPGRQPKKVGELCSI